MLFGLLRTLTIVLVEILAVLAAVIGILLLAAGVHGGARLLAGGVVAFCCARLCASIERSRAAGRRDGLLGLSFGLGALAAVLPELLVAGTGWAVYRILIATIAR
jgi:hypothetical protein